MAKTSTTATTILSSTNNEIILPGLEHNNRTDSKSITLYMVDQKALRKDHPVLHYFYLSALIIGAFVSLFVIPVALGMLATIGGIGTPFILSIVGSFLGLFLGAVFGILFAVVCIVFLIKYAGIAAEWVLGVLSNGGNDLIEITKGQIMELVKNTPFQ